MVDDTRRTLPQLPSLTETPAAGDLFYIVDVDDDSESIDGTSKKITADELFGDVASEEALTAHISNTSNPHETGMSQLSDFNADNNKIGNVSTPDIITDAANKGYVDTVDTAARAYTNTAVSLASQLLTNGCFDIWQRSTTFTTPNDDLFTADRWLGLVETHDSWTFSRSTDVPTGGVATYSMKATNVLLNNQCAFVQILEYVDAKKITGKTVSLSFYAKTNGTEIANLRASVLAWTGTADTVTSDVVGTWASGGTDPTWAANWTSEIAGANKALTSSWQRFTVEGIVLDTASTNNLAVVIWLDDGTIAADDDFFITGIQLNEGSIALPLAYRTFGEELRACMRYYQKSFPYNVDPVSNAGTYLGAIYLQNLSQAGMAYSLRFQVPMRDTPNITTYNPSAANEKWYDASNGQSRDRTIEAQTSNNSMLISSGAFSAGGNYSHYIHWQADAEL